MSEEGTGRFWTVVKVTSIVALAILAVMALAVVVSEVTATDESETFDVSEPVSAVHITTNGGHVDVVGSSVVGGDDATIQIVRTSHYSIVEPDGVIEVNDMTLTLSDGCAHSVLLIPNCTVDFELRVPADTNVTVDGTRTDVTVTGVSGNVHIDTTAADIQLNSTTGAITIEAEGSDIHSNEMSGAGASVSTSKGSVLLEYVDPPRVIVASTTVGPVTVLVPQNSYAVEVSAANGDVEVGVIDDPTSERIISVTNSVGDVVIQARP